jgi:hypothetical protein
VELNGCLNLKSICHQPNWAVKRTPTQAMASPFSWPVLVPSAPSVLRCRLPWALGLTCQHLIPASRLIEPNGQLAANAPQGTMTIKRLSTKGFGANAERVRVRLSSPPRNSKPPTRSRSAMFGIYRSFVMSAHQSHSKASFSAALPCRIHRPNWALQGTPPPPHASATPSARP